MAGKTVRRLPSRRRLSPLGASLNGAGTIAIVSLVVDLYGNHPPRSVLRSLSCPERRRRWSVEQKQAIVAAAFRPSAVVRNVARQADVTSSLIYRWRRDLE